MVRHAIDTPTGTRWIAALGDMRKTSEQAVLEERVAALEQPASQAPAIVTPLRVVR
jgi:hypothetical protein